MPKKVGVNEEALPPKELRRLLEYNADTGEIFFLPRPLEYSVTEADNLRWNRRHAGTRAMTTLNNGGLEGFILGVPMSASRVAWALHHGEWPKGVITHRNLDRTDLRAENLIDTDFSGQCRKASKRKDNSTGVQGVNWHKANQKWTASIYVNGKSKYLGSFKDFEDAVAARRDAEVAHGFHENHGLTPRVVRRRDGTLVPNQNENET